MSYMERKLREREKRRSTLYFLGSIFGEVYYGREFADLDFPEEVLDMFERASKLYNEKRYDFCLLEVWKFIEGILKSKYSGPPVEKTSKLVWKLKDEGVLEESDALILQAVLHYRNKVAHAEKLNDKDALIVKGILILSIPLIWKLLKTENN